MERLTDKNDVENYFYPKCFEKCDGLGASSKCNNCEIMTSVCEKLGKYEDLEERGRLVILPCKDVYYIVDINNPRYAMVTKSPIRELAIYEIENIDKSGCKYFSTEEKAEAKLKELRGGIDDVHTCNCQHDSNSRDNEPCCRCDSRQTNADRIRNMSDEELAEFLAVHDLGLKGNDLPMLTDWLEWLQLEVE